MASPVLVVDDDANVRDALRMVLHDDGYAVETASGGEEALALLAGGLRPALVLLDLMMPGMSGWQVIEVMQRDRELSAVPVVVVAARSMRSSGVSGVAGFIEKPFDLMELLATVARVARQPQWQAEPAR